MARSSKCKGWRHLYVGSTPEVAISEAVLRWRDRIVSPAPVILARSQIESRILTGLRARRTPTVIDQTGFGLARLLPLQSARRPQDIFLADASHYPRTQAWGAWFRGQRPDAVGIRWVSRQHNLSCCYVFFDDTPGADSFEQVGMGEHLAETRTAAYHLLLQDCLDRLGWEIDR